MVQEYLTKHGSTPLTSSFLPSVEKPRNAAVPCHAAFLIGVAPFCPFSASLLRSPRRLNLLPWRNTFAKSAGLQLVYYKTIQKSTVGTIPKQSQLAP
jgi:hypothetical protein